MDLQEFVLTYTGDGDSPVINIADYYEKYVKPLSPAFAKSSFHTSNTVVCCFHDDVNPSLGTINHKHLRGVRVFHCFGCGAAGDVIRMHQRVQYEYHHRRISMDESALELCDLFGVDASTYKNNSEDERKKSKYVDKISRIMSAMESYSLSEFKDEILPARRQDITLREKIGILNTATIKMAATKKKLYD